MVGSGVPGEQLLSLLFVNAYTNYIKQNRTLGRHPMEDGGRWYSGTLLPARGPSESETGTQSRPR